MKIALVIIFNHNYEKNIPVLKKLYGQRFSSIFILMPFYRGDDPSVIPVYENSRYFQGYLTQALRQYFREEFTHYLFIGDDLILNPSINENNCADVFRLQEETCFIPTLTTLHTRPLDQYWFRVRDAFYFRPNVQGAEMAGTFPDYAAAEARFRKHGLEIKPLQYRQVFARWQDLEGRRAKYRWLKRFIALFRKRNNLTLQYPLVGSYSDILIVSKPALRDFVHYCGVFSVAELFVELAIPTALVLASDSIRTEADLEKQGAALWTKEDYQRLDKYNFSLTALLNDFPAGNLYLHPIKLSKWK